MEFFTLNQTIAKVRKSAHLSPFLMADIINDVQLKSREADTEEQFISRHQRKYKPQHTYYDNDSQVFV